MHLFITVGGILIMWGIAWMFTWYKGVAEKSGSRQPSANADLVGGGP
jgi:hypothetical protein